MAGEDELGSDDLGRLSLLIASEKDGNNTGIEVALTSRVVIGTEISRSHVASRFWVQTQTSQQ